MALHMIDPMLIKLNNENHIAIDRLQEYFSHESVTIILKKTIIANRF